MIQGIAPVWQALLGTLFTWGLTAAGSAAMFLVGTGRPHVSLVIAGGILNRLTGLLKHSCCFKSPGKMNRRSTFEGPAIDSKNTNQ